MKVKVSTSSSSTVKVNTQSSDHLVSVGIQGPPGPQGYNEISNAIDADTTDLRDGSLLVYKTNTQKWTSTTTLDAQNLEGGEF